MAEFSLLLGAVAASLPLTLLTTYALQPLADARRRLPPGPRPLPVIGNLLDVGENPHRSFASLADLHGPLMLIRLGTVPAVVATSPAAAREVLQRKNASLAARRGLDAWRVMDHDANSMIALPPRGKWRALRQLTTSALLGAQRLDEHRAVREEEVRELVRRVSASSGTGGAPVAVARASFGATADVLCRGMFSRKLDPAVVSELTDVASEAAVLSGLPNVSDFFPALAPLDLQGIRRKAGKLVAWLYALIDEQAEQRRLHRAAGEARRSDLLDVLLDMDGEVQDEDGWAMNNESIRGLFMELLLGATSVSTTIEWAMAELLQNPHCMLKLQQELRSVLGTKQMEESDIGRLPYLQAVMKETLRLHPPVPFATGLAEAAVEVHGYNIPKGTAALVNIWGICRDAEVWEEPGRFMPDRFLHGEEIDYFGADFELVSFSAGRRICPGLQLSSRIVPLMLGSLLYHFDWTLSEEDDDPHVVDMTEKFGLVLSMAVPLCAIPKKV